MCIGGCNWNMSNIFWEMFYNIIYHISEGGFISFWIIPLPYLKVHLVVNTLQTLTTTENIGFPTNDAKIFV